MVLCHRRPYLLREIVRQCFKLWPDNTVVHFCMDRPTPGVELEVERLVTTALAYKARAYYAPFPAVSSQGERYMDLRNVQVEAMEQDNPKYIAFWDDDQILQDPEELAAVVRADQSDLIYATKQYLWDSPRQYTTHLPKHTSVFVWRHTRGDRFPTDNRRIIQAPVGVHDNPASRRYDLCTALLDVGYMFEKERRQIFKAYARAGKVDDLVLGLLDKPVLKKVQRVSSSHELLIQAIDEYQQAKPAVH